MAVDVERWGGSKIEVVQQTRSVPRNHFSVGGEDNVRSNRLCYSLDRHWNLHSWNAPENIVQTLCVRTELIDAAAMSRHAFCRGIHDEGVVWHIQGEEVIVFAFTSRFVAYAPATIQDHDEDARSAYLAVQNILQCKQEAIIADKLLRVISSVYGQLFAVS